MTIEQMTELSELTAKASAISDIETLKKIKCIIDNDNDEFKSPMGAEWFYSSLTTAQIDALESIT
jgi:hypothetical protein